MGDRMRPFVSIVMPVYNQEKYIKECLESVIRQTLKNIEIIVVNDGSTDNTMKIVNGMKTSDNRIKVIDKPNTGYGNTMNIGIASAIGDYIGIVETDDFVDYSMYKSLYSLTQNGAVDIVKGNFYNYYEKENNEHYEFVNTERNDLPSETNPFQLREYPQILWGHPSVWSAIYKRSFLINNHIVFKEEKGGGWVDNPFFFETLCKAQSIVWTSTPFYHYRKTNLSSSSNGVVNPNLPFDRMNDNLDVLEENNYTDDVSLKLAYSRALMYTTGAYKECDYNKNFDIINYKATKLLQRCDPDIFEQFFNYQDQMNFLKYASPLNSIMAKAKKLLIYNWLPYDNPWHWGGGVTVYCRNLIKHLIKVYPMVQIYYLSSGFAYAANTTKTYVRRIGSEFGDRCYQFEIVNSPIPADQRNLYRNPTVAIKNEKLKKVFRDFLDTYGPFEAIHFNNIEGISFDVFDLKQDYPETQFVYSLHNYIPMCITNGYYDRAKHCVCSEKHTAQDCMNCSRMDIKSDISKITYNRGLFGIDKATAIYSDKWIYELNLHELDEDVSLDHILDFQKNAIQQINKNCDTILAVSKRVYDIALLNGFDKNKMQVSYIGTQVAQNQIRSASSPIPSNKMRIVFLGSDLYFEEKGYPFLLDALEKLPKEYASKIELVLTMSQNEDAKIRERLKYFSGINIIHGYKHEDLINIFKGCHLSIIPVLWEDNLPQIAIESVAYGVPVLASDFGGASELCSSPLFKFKGGDSASFTEKLLHFVDYPKDLSLYWQNHNGLVTMAEHIREIAKYYNIDSISNSVEFTGKEMYYLIKERDFLYKHFSIDKILSSEHEKNLNERINSQNSIINKYKSQDKILELVQENHLTENSIYWKLIKKLNKIFPYGSKRRAFFSRIFGKRKEEN